jgi:hypothetical protein
MQYVPVDRWRDVYDRDEFDAEGGPVNLAGPVLPKATPGAK